MFSQNRYQRLSTIKGGTKTEKMHVLNICAHRIIF